jgi:2-polyprenyl-3-methyl-5-hydroxy-6-metoxy-1,4-benzoquinol methylase
MSQKSHSNLVDRSCSVCCKSEREVVFKLSTDNIVGFTDAGYIEEINICNNCGFVYSAPLPPESLIKKYYEHMSNYEHHESSGIRPIEDIKQIQRQIDIISKRFPNNFIGKALDIDCSIAYGLSLWKERGWEVLGLDPSDQCIEVSKKKLNVTVFKGFFSPELLSQEKPFDLIILSHVLEHLTLPRHVLQELRNILSDDGLIYIEVPNTIKPNNTHSYFGFEHVNYFTPTSLANLSHAAGFEVDWLDTFDNGRHIHPFYPVISATIKKTEKKFPLQVDRKEILEVIDNYKRQDKELIEKLNSKIYSILESTDKGRLALWGAGIHTSHLLHETMLDATDICCIYDNNPKKSGGQLKGLEVRNFPASVLEAKSEVDAILISSEASESAIYAQLKYLENHGIKIYCLYI